MVIRISCQQRSKFPRPPQEGSCMNQCKIADMPDTGCRCNRCLHFSQYLCRRYNRSWHYKTCTLFKRTSSLQRRRVNHPPPPTVHKKGVTCRT